jgi:copper(I)-binding protein
MKKILLSALMFCACSVNAQVVVEQPWVRGTVAAQRATGAFMTLKSDKPVSLVSAASSAAKVVEIHEMKMENNVMKMQAVSKIDLVPGKATELKPGSFHIMLFDLAKPLTAGESVPITLEFKGADGKSVKQEVKAEVRDMTGKPGMKM